MNENKSMGLWAAISIGVGAMIGAGIFALIGIAVEIAGNLAYLSFAIGGIIALLTSYSVAKLATTFPSQGGRVQFLIEGFGSGVLSGGFNILMWVGYVFVTSLYANAFANYTMELLPSDYGNIWYHILATGIVLIFAVINFIGAKVVGKSELLIVATKVVILIGFAIVGLFFIVPSRFSLSTSPSLYKILITGGIVFLSYEGFGLIANTAEDIKNPHKNLPRALFISVSLVGVIYILVTLTVIGNLSISDIIKAEEYALAQSAKPFLGTIGFKLIAIAALFSTSSAINATIYGPVYMVYETAKAGQLPRFFIKKIYKKESGVALLITVGLIIFFTNTFDLKSIAELGSVSFLLIYAAVNIAHLRLYKKTGANVFIIWLAIIGCIFAFMMLVYYVSKDSPITLIVFGIVLVFSFIFELIYKKYSPNSSE